MERIPYATIPPKVEYVLTKSGQSLEPVLTELCRWGKEYML
ncbi:winged helix-turn-helix transcriptional regulator [Alkaliphilus peptidifermentans]|nr:winged helix-turn-helix transcriptional regulator [Alkaliphilus peptidifermentans]